MTFDKFVQEHPIPNFVRISPTVLELLNDEKKKSTFGLITSIVEIR
jgi:hypothetical protein